MVLKVALVAPVIGFIAVLVAPLSQALTMNIATESPAQTGRDEGVRVVGVETNATLFFFGVHETLQ